MSRLPPLPLPPARGAGTARFVASLALMVVVVGIAAYRLDFISGSAGLAALGLGLLLALMALAIVSVTLRDVWRDGRQGAGSAVLTLAMIAVTVSPLIVAVAALIAYPALDSVSTDLDDPPAPPAGFSQVALPIDLRTASDEAAEKQEDAYPDLTTQVSELSTVEAYALARQTLDDIGWPIRAAEEPDTEAASGRLEAVARSLILGIDGDVVVRISPDGGRSRIDIRSLSRVAMPDLGENARHVDTFISRFAEVSRRQAAN